MRVYGILKDSLINGPGIRLTIFLQGCNIYCKGCHNKESWDPAGGYSLSIQDLEDYLTPLTTGITISGGEPTLQYAAVRDLCDWAREKGLSTMLFTGLTDEKFYELIKYDAELKSNLDYVKTGPFIEELRCIDKQYGSKNQRSEPLEDLIHRCGRNRENNACKPIGTKVEANTPNEYNSKSPQESAGNKGWTVSSTSAIHEFAC